MPRVLTRGEGETFEILLLYTSSHRQIDKSRGENKQMGRIIANEACVIINLIFLNP